MSDALPLPFDVRLMNLTAAALVLVVSAVGLAGGLWWLLRHPAFAIAGITVQGDLVHHNAVTLRANVMPRLSGNFFTLDLAATRAAFEDVPWVRRAVVRREFPNRLQVRLQEHRAAAWWGPEPDTRLVNVDGEVFEATLDDLEPDALPRLSGPDGQAAWVLGMYRSLVPVMQGLDMAIDELELTARGNWRLRTDQGAVIELGRGEPATVAARLERFTRTVTQVVARHGRTVRALESADLRHEDGYALRLQGVSTTDTPPPPGAPRAARPGNR